MVCGDHSADRRLRESPAQRVEKGTRPLFRLRRLDEHHTTVLRDRQCVVQAI